MSCRRGQTLVELIIVIAIILIVMTMVVVTLAKVYTAIEGWRH